MDYQSLHIKTVADLRKLAKDMGLKIPAGTKKSVLIDMLLEADNRAPKPAEKPAAKPKPAAAEAKKPAAEAPQKPAEVPQKPAAEEAKKPAEEAPKKPAEEAPQKSAAEKPQKPATRRGRPPKAARAAETPAQPAEAKGRAKASDDKSKAKPAEAKPAASASPEKTPEVKPEVKSEAKPAAKPEAKPQAAPAVNGARRMVQNRGAMPFRANPRPAAETPQRGRFQNRNGARQPSGDARGAGTAAQRALGYRNNRPEAQPRTFRPAEAAPAQAVQPAAAAQPASPAQTAEQERPARPEGYYNAEYRTSNPAVPEMLAAGECGDGAGVLEIQPDGYGFLRAENCLPGPNDVYISIAQIRRFNLRNGDYVVGKTRAQREGDRFGAMLYITEVNGESPEKTADRSRFEDLVPIYPDERLRLEPPEGKADLSLRLIDMLAPIGKGQRGMIVSQPKAGKTTLLKKVANAITTQYPDVHLIVLLIDERPEEVTDMQRSINGEVIYSTFDEEPEHHTRVSEMVLARAQRLVEMGKDVVVLMDSITRLARAYNLTITPTGRSLSGGLDPGALFKPKRFFGAARNIENGGSLTVIATALVETGSRMDDIIFEEFKGTGNMELHLDRKLSDRRVFPAIDLVKSGTRREELLLSDDEMNGELQVRRMLSGGKQQEMYESLIDLMSKTSSNAEFFTKLKGWLAVVEKEGYSLGR